MTSQLLTDSLFRELLFTSMLLLVILLVNNLVLYRQKLTSRFSMMLLFGAVMCLSELLWDAFDDHVEQKAFIYLFAGAYTMAFLCFTDFFSLYFLERFGIRLSRKWMAIVYGLPDAAMLVLCATTPWTHWLFVVDEAGLVQEMPLYETLFYGLLWAYNLTALMLAVRYMLFTRKKDANLARIARSLIIFGVLLPTVYIMQILIIGDASSEYIALSLAVAISLVYLSENVNLHALLSSREQMEAVEADLRVATTIQASSLPNTFPAFPNRQEFDLYASMDPAKEVGGDFYDFFLIDDRHLGLAIADVSGKGVPASLFMMVSKLLLKICAEYNPNPAEVLEQVNDRICADNPEEMFVTVWFGVLDTETGELTAANAGHEYPVLMRGGGQFELVQDEHGFFIGAVEGARYRNYTLQLTPGSKLFVYTDGVPEATNAEKELFGTDRMLSALNANTAAAPEDILKQMRQAVDGFVKDAPQFDDLTMLCLEYRGPGGEPPQSV